MKKTTTGAIVVAIIVSILLLPMIFVMEIAGGSVVAVSTVYEENWLLRFEENGGMHWLYQIALETLEEAEGRIQLPEDIHLFDQVIYEEDVKQILYEIYDAIAENREYKFDLSVQKNRVKKNAERCLKEYADIYFNKMLGDNAEKIVSTFGETIVDDNVKEEFKRQYLEDIYVQIDAEVDALELQLDLALAEVRSGIDVQFIPEIRPNITFSVLNAGYMMGLLKRAAAIAFGSMGAFMLILLVAYLFRPAGFFITGAVTVISGTLMLIFSRTLPQVMNHSQVTGWSDSSMTQTLGEALTTFSEGYFSCGLYGVFVGGVLWIIGMIVIAFRKKQP